MNKSEKKQLIDEVNSSILETEKDILYLKEHTKPVSPENAIGRVSRMDAINNLNINKSLLTSKETHLENLKQVIMSIENPEFGVCTRCKKGIPLKRIMSVPNSTLCVPCIREIQN